jgi:hypothetical protein
MAELFRHTDEDGDTLWVVGVDYLRARPVVVSIDDHPVGIFLDRDAALRLSDALLNHYGLKDITEEEAS